MEADLVGRLAGGLEKSHHCPTVGIGRVFALRLVEEVAGEVEILCFSKRRREGVRWERGGVED